MIVTASCGCFVDRANRVMGKCEIHARNNAVCGFTKVLLTEMVLTNGDANV